MSSLFNAINNTTTTTNCAVAYKSTNNACLDLFFVIGTARGQDITDLFYKAYNEDADLALRILLWSRDVREGAGERQRFRDLLKFLVENNPSVAILLIRKIPEIGRWDDLWSCYGLSEEYDRAVLQQVRLGLGV